MLVDQEGLWFKVLVAKYGLEDGRVMGGGGKASWWWKDMCGVREGVRLSVGRWFENNIRRKAGDGENTYFLRDKWLGVQLFIPIFLDFLS
jgi:hypothetical protein